MSDTPPLGTPPASVSKPDHTWELLCHLTALAGFLIPFGFILGPMVVWLIKRESIPAVDAHGKEAMNFQISFTIYAIVAGLTIFIGIGFLLVPVVILADVILLVIATIKASQGELYRYPFTIRLIK